MPFPNDNTLSARPDLFRLVESPRQARVFRMASYVCPTVSAVIGIWVIVQGPTWWIGLIVIAFGLSGFFVMRNMANKVREWAMLDGRALTTRTLVLLDDPADATKRLATGDPSQYTPMRVKQETDSDAPNHVHAFWPEDGQQVSYVVVTGMKGAGRGDPPVLELKGTQHQQFQAALAKGLGTPYGA